jgi:hypothetical protein
MPFLRRMLDLIAYWLTAVQLRRVVEPILPRRFPPTARLAISALLRWDRTELKLVACLVDFEGVVFELMSEYDEDLPPLIGIREGLPELPTGRPEALYSSPEWLSVLRKAYGYDIRALDVGDSVLPVARVDPNSDRLVALPFSDTVQPVGGPMKLADVVARLDSVTSAWTLRARGDEVAGDLPSGTGRIDPWSAIDLDDSVDAWARLRPSARRKVRSAARSGVIVRRSTSPEDLDVFLQLHLQRRKSRYGLLSQPRRFFFETWNEFDPADRCWLLVAEQEGRAVASSMFLAAGDILYYKFNASNEAGGTSGANYLLLWDAMERALAVGFSQIDLGLSPSGQQGLLQFKDAFFHCPKRHHHHRTGRSGPAR